MKFQELKNKEHSELNEILKETRTKFSQLKFELAGKSLKDSSQIGKTKTDIARILTAMEQKTENKNFKK